MTEEHVDDEAGYDDDAEYEEYEEYDEYDEYDDDGYYYEDDEHNGAVDEWGRVFDDERDAYVRVPKQAGRIRKGLWVLLAVLATLGVVAGTAVVWVQRQIDPPGAPGEAVSFEIEEGATVSSVATTLEENGIIANAMVFRLWARREGFDAVQAGLYENLRENSSFDEAVAGLEEGPAAPPASAFVTVPPGLRASEIVPRLVENPDISFDFGELGQALLDVQSSYFEFRPAEIAGTPEALEGFFYPETYRIEAGDEGNEALLVNQMVASMDAALDTHAYREAPTRWGLTPYEMMVVASIIEREAQVDEDFGKVSRVIHNRLELGMKLEIDATLLYAIGHQETLFQSDLETDTPYNTRLYAGLPPTPIAMPSEMAIEAAMNPLDGPWIFYVLAAADGSHFFTDDFDEFNRVAQESRDAGLFE